MQAEHVQKEHRAHNRRRGGSSQHIYYMVFFKQLTTHPSRSVITEVELERKSIIHKHGNVGSRYFFQACLYDSSMGIPLHGVLTLGASLKSVRSRFGLVVLIPRSSLSRNSSVKQSMKSYMSPSSLALLEASANIQDVIIVDDMGVNDRHLVENFIHSERRRMQPCTREICVYADK